jgi:hypothetical protein
MMWTCPHCGAENPFTTPICRKCEEIRAIVGGGSSGLGPITQPELEQKDTD